MPRNGVKNKHGPVSGFQPRALFSGRRGGRVREMSGISQPGGSGVSGHWVTSAQGTRGHSWCHITAVTELRPSGEQCGHCSLQPLTPRVLELPPQFPSLPFLTRRSCHVHPLICCLQHLVLEFLGFFSSRAQSAPPHCPGGSSTQSAFKHLLFDLQNSAQKPLIVTFSDFFFLPFTWNHYRSMSCPLVLWEAGPRPGSWRTLVEHICWMA